MQLQMDGALSAREVWADQGQRARSTAGSEFYGSREYQHGDPLRRIHWRNTARRGQFVVKEFEETSQGSVLVAFECSREWGSGRETTLEYSVRIAASLARLSGQVGRFSGVLAPPTPLLAAHWMEAMDYLAGLTVGGGAGLEELVASVGPGQTLVAVVPAAATDLIPCLGSLSARGVRLVVVLLEGFAEEEAPGEFVSSLSAGGAGVVHCPRGNLEEAVAALDSSMRFAA
jgi:hypothetical protein